nr:SyfB [Madagascaria erythrocladioides]
MKNITPQELAEKLTISGCEVEEISRKNILEIEDDIFDISSTPNRADLLSIIGIAREIKTILNNNWKHTDKETIKNLKKNLIFNNNTNFISSDVNPIPHFSCIISKIQLKESPDFVQRVLIAADIEPKNSILDVCDYIMLKWGQPLEVINWPNYATNSIEQVNFKIKNDSNNTNKAILTTNYKSETLSFTGVEIREQYIINNNTTNVLLQGCIPPPSIIRNTTKMLNIRTNSTIRYERGLDKNTLEFAYLEAIALLKEIHPEVVISTIYNNVVDSKMEQKAAIQINFNKLESILGPVFNPKKRIVSIDKNDISQILISIGCSIIEKQEESLKVEIPSYRIHDLYREIDLIEEIARIHGFNNFVESLPKFSKQYKKNSRQYHINKIKEKLRFLGFTEVIHYSLINQKENNGVNLKNPLVVEYNTLRSNLLDNLLSAYQYNQKNNNINFEAFEIGRVFSKNNKSTQVAEKEMVAGIFGSNLIRDSWNNPLREMNWFEAKGVIELLLGNMYSKINWNKNIQNKSIVFHHEKSATLIIEEKEIGIFGEVHPKIRKQYAIPFPIYCFEIDLNFLIQYNLNKQSSNITFKPYSTFPVINRDISVLDSLGVSVDSIIKMIYNVDNTILQKIELFDEYKGPNIEDGTRSVSFRLSYKSNFGTLKASEVDFIHEKIKKVLKNKLNLEFR